MANLFAITTVTDKLKADGGSGTTVFTVTNTTARPLRGIARVRTMGNTEAAWLKIEGESERDFPAGGTHQYAVAFNRPKDAPDSVRSAEMYPFRLDVVSAVNPDEDFTEGPVVTVEIPEQPVEEKKPFPWWIAVAAVLLLVVIGVVLWLVLRDTRVEVPNVVGKTLAEAESELTAQGFRAEKVEAVAADKEEGKVFGQEPEAGAKAEPDSVVKVSVPAMVDMPNFKGLNSPAAKNLAEKNELKFLPPVRSRDFKGGDPAKIVFQFPLPGTKVKKGSEVNLFLPCQGILCFNIRDVLGTKFDRKIAVELPKIAATP